MNIDLSEEQRQVRDLCREFAGQELTPNARRWDEEHHFQREAVKKLAEMGLMGVAIPSEWGGAGMDSVAYAVAMEEISRGCAGTGVIMSVSNSLYCDPLLKYGTDEQKREFLTPFARGEKLGCFALTEPMSGSDAAEMRTIAIARGDEYVLSGSKNFITNGPQADVVLIFAMTDRAKGHKGITAFLVDTTRPGFARGKNEPKLGIRASATCEIVFEGYRASADERLGEEGGGFKIAMTVLDAGRIGIASQALGIAEASYAASLSYAREREAFGQPIGQFQGIGFKLADMKTRIEASRLLILQAALAKQRSKETGERYTLQASMAKLFASETAMFCAHAAVQIHGGVGYSKEFPVERYFRDAKITEIYEGTSEIQLVVISRQELGGG